MKIALLDSGININPLLWALQSHPELWNQNTARTAAIDSPHHDVDDIWVRFAPEGLGANENHDSIWYPAADILNIKPLIFSLMTAFNGEKLGGVLITRIPPGKEVKPHTDLAWHAREYEKFAVQVASAPGQKFCFEYEELEAKPGDLYWFNNAFEHWVINPTQYERITLIVCIKRSV